MVWKFFLEKVFNKKLGIETKASYASIFLDNKVNYVHTNDVVAGILKDEHGLPTYAYNQNVDLKMENIFIYTGLTHLENSGNFTYSLVGKQRNLRYFQRSINNDTGNAIDGFNMDNSEYRYSDVQFAVKHFKKLGSFTFDNQISILYSKTPKTFIDENHGINLNFDLKLSYSPEMFTTYSFDYKNVLYSYPLLKHILIKKVIDFQTIQTPASNIELVKEQIIEGSVYKNLSIFELTAAYLNGKSNTNDIFKAEDSFFVFKESGQLESNYHVASVQLKTKIKKIPLEIIMEPEAIWYKNQNLSDNQIYFTKTRWLLLGLKINSIKKISRFDFKVYPKYTRIDYSNDLKEQKNYQSIVSLMANTSYEIINNKMRVGFNFRNVNFGGLSMTTFNIADIYIDGMYEKWRWNLELSNLFNAKSYETQINSPVFFLNQSNSIFGRYIKLGVEFKFD